MSRVDHSVEFGGRRGVRVSSLTRFFVSSPGLIATRIVICGVLLLLWELASQSTQVRFWVGSPTSIIERIWEWIADGSLFVNLTATLLAMLLGYAIGCFSGIASGLAFGFFPRVHRVLAPYVAALYALPKIALAPLFVIMLGIGIGSKVALVAITVFFPLLNSTLDGLHDLDRDLVQALRVMGASQAEVVVKVMMPGAMPWIFTGMRISVRYALTAAILGELIAANKGIGFLIEYSAGNFDGTGLCAAVIVVVFCSVVFTEILARIETSTGRGR